MKEREQREKEEAEQKEDIVEEQRQELVFVDESVGDYLSFIDDLQERAKELNCLYRVDELLSELAPGGVVRWRRIETDSETVEVEWSEIDWEEIQSVYGVAGIMAVAWFWAEVEVPEDCVAVAVAERLGSFRLNGEPSPGDPYGRGIVRAPPAAHIAEPAPEQAHLRVRQMHRAPILQIGLR